MAHGHAPESGLQENGETGFEAGSSTTVPLDTLRTAEIMQRAQGHLVGGTLPWPHRPLGLIGSGDPRRSVRNRAWTHRFPPVPGEPRKVSWDGVGVLYDTLPRSLTYVSAKLKLCDYVNLELTPVRPRQDIAGYILSPRSGDGDYTRNGWVCPAPVKASPDA